MNSSQTAGSPEVFVSSDEIEEDIIYHKTILHSMDETTPDREQAEVQVKAEIRRLERILHAEREAERKRNTVSHPLSSSSISHSFPHNQSSFVMPSAQRGTTMQGNGITPSPPTPKSSSSALTKMLSPSLPTRKRNLGETGEHEMGNKAKRASPSPHVTRPSTPSLGYDVQGRSKGNYGFNADDEGTRRILERHRRAEEKAKMEKADAEFARQLQEESGDIPSVFSTDSQPSSQNGTSAFERLLGRAPLQHQHTFGQPSATHSSLSQSFQPVASESQAFGSNNGPSAFPGGLSMNSDPGYQRLLDIPGSFPRDLPEDSDSDIEVIPASAFQDNGRRPLSQLNSVQPNGTAQVQTYSATERARQAAVHRLANPHLQYGASYNPYDMPPVLPLGAGMGSQHLGKDVMDYNPYSQSFGPSRSHVYQNETPVEMDPLRAMIQKTSKIDWNALPPYGNPYDDPNRLAELNDYVNDPRKTAQEIKELLDNIRPDEEIPKENREGTPDGLKYALYEHQKLALAWLKSMEEGTNRGGILADDMGLGKTISALALILSRPSTERSCKTTLIVGPVALVRQWEREIQTKLNRSHRLSTFLFHSGKKATWDVLRNFDIILTTYGTLGAEYKRLEALEKKFKEDPAMDKSAYVKKLPFLGESSKWYRVILDEAQCIKNKATMAAKACCSLKSMTRFCLTGTPMMNGVHELYSLIHFLRIRPYNEYGRFTSEFGCLSKTSAGTRNNPNTEKKAMKKLQAVLKAILLRRTKTSKIDGKDILTLPEKKEEIVHAIFNTDEQAYYTALEQRVQIQFNKYVKAGTIGKNYSNVLVLLLRLRQAACHPNLIMDFEEAPPETTVRDMITLAKSMLPDVIGRIIAATVPFECPVCYDPIPNPRIIIPCGHDTCAGCLVRISDTAQEEGVANGDEHAQNNAKCPTCRGKIEKAKIIDYETFKNVHMKGAVPNPNDEETQSEDGDGNESIDVDSSDSESEADSDVDSDRDIRDFIVPDDYESGEDDIETEDDENDELGEEDEYAKVEKPKSESEAEEEGVNVKGEVKDENSDEDFVDIKDIEIVKKEKAKAKTSKHVKKEPTKKSIKSKKSKKGKGKSKIKEPEIKHTTLAELKKEATRSAIGRKRYMKYLRKNWISSAKVDKCMEILDNTPEGVKTIIFSQFTTLLDLLEVPLRQKRVGLTRYDGTMSADARHVSVVNFTDDPSIRFMLVSLKAGNAGLNLVAASQVIILDPFWNPFIEMQAVDRAHRIGQQKPVTVHRILVQGTVEDRIIELQIRKRKLIEAALDEKASAGMGRLGRQELIYLFNGGDGSIRETLARPAANFNNIRIGAAGNETPSPSPSGSSGSL